MIFRSEFAPSIETRVLGGLTTVGAPSSSCFHSVSTPADSHRHLITIARRVVRPKKPRRVPAQPIHRSATPRRASFALELVGRGSSHLELWQGLKRFISKSEKQIWRLRAMPK